MSEATMITAAIYTRVSTSAKSGQNGSASYDQNPEVQEQPLRELVSKRGWTLHKVYSDRASGAKEQRPGLDALMADARKGAFNALAVFRFDRFARSSKQLVLALEEFRSLGIEFVSLHEAIDTSTAMGKAMFTVTAAFAELERGTIRERVVAGIEYAKKHGTKSGRSIGRPKAIFRRDQVKVLRAQGLSWREIARAVGASIASVRRACQT
jgi:DNA invertase Pin-like site-specific DNA recombinase